jgi:hypothetical protein
MDNWHPNIVYQMALDRHQENVARGVAKQLAAVPGSRPVRTRLATALTALARRLDPARHAPLQEVARVTPSTPA